MHAYLLTVSPDWINPAKVVVGSIFMIDPCASVYIYTLDSAVPEVLEKVFPQGDLRFVVLEEMSFTYSEWFSTTYEKPSYMTLRVSAVEHLLGNSEVDKILYLDTDTLPMPSMLSIWQEDTRGNAVSAIRDIGRSAKRDYSYITKHEYDDWYERFNGGVMLFDLSVIRQMYPTGFELKESSYANYKLADQEFLFDKFKDSLTYLPYQYNYSGDPRVNGAFKLDYMLSGLVYSSKSCHIIHFVGPGKPWSSSVKLERNLTTYHRIIALPYYLYYERCREMAYLLDDDFLSDVENFYEKVGKIGELLKDCCEDS